MTNLLGNSSQEILVHPCKESIIIKIVSNIPQDLGEGGGEENIDVGENVKRTLFGSSFAPTSSSNLDSSCDNSSHFSGNSPNFAPLLLLPPPPPPSPPSSPPMLGAPVNMHPKPRVLNIAPFLYFYRRPRDDPNAYVDRLVVVVGANQLLEANCFTYFLDNLLSIAREWYANLQPRPAT